MRSIQDRMRRAQKYNRPPESESLGEESWPPAETSRLVHRTGEHGTVLQTDGRRVLVRWDRGAPDSVVQILDCRLEQPGERP